MAVWTGPGREVLSGIDVIEAASRPADGGSERDGWTSPETLSTGGVGGEGAQVAINPQGRATAVWRRIEGAGELSRNFAVAASRDPHQTERGG